MFFIFCTIPEVFRWDGAAGGHLGETPAPRGDTIVRADPLGRPGGPRSGPARVTHTFVSQLMGKALFLLKKMPL